MWGRGWGVGKMEIGSNVRGRGQGLFNEITLKEVRSFWVYNTHLCVVVFSDPRRTIYLSYLLDDFTIEMFHISQIRLLSLAGSLCEGGVWAVTLDAGIIGDTHF